MFGLETNKAIALRLVEVFNARRLNLLEDVLHHNETNEEQSI